MGEFRKNDEKPTLLDEECNLVMILFALSTAFSFEDTKPIEERIKEARNSGYSIPPELLQNLE